jgi:MFS superfamily sulfate permease-like transporter
VKKNKVLSLIPGPLLAIVISVGVSALFIGTDLSLVAEPTAAVIDATTGQLAEPEPVKHLVDVPTPSNFDEFKAMFYFPNFSAISDPAVWRVALVIALVASIESLLCVEATDKMDPNKGRTPMNRELRAQGIGNLFSGLLGGLPITQVIVRSTANIGAGAKTKMSAIIHGIFLLAFILAIPGVLNLIPRATLAAVLLLIGWKLASPKSIIAMVKSGWAQWVPFFTTIGVMLFTDLLKGVFAGLIIAFLIILYRNFKMSFFLNDESADGKVHLKLSQHTTFLNKASIMKRLDTIKEGKEVVIDLSETISIDYDVKEAINDFIEGAEDRDIKIELIHGEKLEQAKMSH